MSFGPLRKVSDPPIKVIRVYPVTPVSSVVKIFVHGSSQRNRLFGREFTELSLGGRVPFEWTNVSATACGRQDASTYQLSLHWIRFAMSTDADVIIIGAGVAGFAAAAALNQYGPKVGIFDGRDCVGGRVLTRQGPVC